MNPLSSMTTALSSPSGSPGSGSWASRRAGVMWIGSPTRLSGIWCPAASACTLVTPGITVHPKPTAASPRTRSMIRSIES